MNLCTLFLSIVGGIVATYIVRFIDRAIQRYKNNRHQNG